MVSLKDVFMTGLHKWKWIVGSVVVCVGLGGLYLARTPSKYTATAAVEIKDDDANSSMNSALSAFADMGLGTANANLYNEMAYFQSPDLMESVVKTLDLTTTYHLKEGLKTVIPYGKKVPVTVTFLDNPEKLNGSFKLVVKDGMVELSKFRIKKDKLDYESPRFAINSKVKTPFGWILVQPGPAYEPGESYNMRVAKSTVEGSAATWSERLKVSEQNKDGTVIDLTLVDQSPERARDILASLINAYNENWILDKNQVAVSTSNFINDRLLVIEDELGDVDSDISSYKSENMVPDVATTAALYLTENQELNKQLLDINNQLQMARFLRDHLAANPRVDQALPANLGLVNQSIDALLAKYNDLLIQRNSIIMNSSESNPLVMDIDQRLKSLRSSLLGALDNSIRTLSTDMKNLEGKQGTVNRKIAASPSQAKYLLSVERQQKVKESLYLYLLQKREENELTQAFTAYNTRIIARPAVDTDATSPRKGMILGAAFLLGLLIPFGVVYVQEISNTKVRSRDDLSKLTLPFIGEIPTIKVPKGENKDAMMVVKPGERNGINEAFRVIRTNLSFLHSEDKGEAEVIMITSFNPGSGKTFITMNLAESLAIRGSKVLVIDADLRRGSTSVYINSPKSGLAQYLSGKVTDLDSIIKPTDYSSNLFVIPAGNVPPNPTELIENGRLNEVVERLKKEYDYIFLDCPPIGIVADARIIEQMCTRTIFVIRAGLFDRAMIPELEKLYQEKTYTNLVMMLNGSYSGGGYGYGKYHYGGYGYGSYGGKNYYTQDK